jgi:RNA polymerase sigma factor (sigma-70 family)
MVHTDLRGSDGEITQIVTAAANGDEQAWDQIVARYSGLLWAVGRAHRLNAADAADVVQTTWLRLVEHLPQIRNREGIGSWLATTARRECLRVLRSGARCQPSEEMQLLVDAGADHPELDSALLTAERDAELWAAFSRLPDRDQALLRLLAVDSPPSYEEISAALGMPIGSIGPTRARSLERLRRELSRVQRRGAVAGSR